MTPAPGPFDTARATAARALPLAVLLAVFIGGCAGGLARYAVVRAWPAAPRGFPLSTLVVNVSGAFLLGLLLVVAAELIAPSTYVRPLLGTGFCGAWTTFSSVVASVDELVAHGRGATAAQYLVASIAGGLLAAALGMALGRSASMLRHRTTQHGRI